MDHSGIDVPKRGSQIYILAEEGEVVEQRIRTESERFAAVPGTRPRARILIEPSTDSEWVAPCRAALGPEGVPEGARLGRRPPQKPMAQRWQPWRRHDPIHLVERYRALLKSLRGIYIDCGWRDQHHIHFGSRILSQRLAAAGARATSTRNSTTTTRMSITAWT